MCPKSRLVPHSLMGRVAKCLEVVTTSVIKLKKKRKSSHDQNHRRKTQNRQKIDKGLENISSEKIDEKIGKPRQTLKNT
jgi:hypothetical protein